MSNLLLKLVGNPTMNRTIFPPQIYLYDDVMIYRKRSLFKIREITIAYSHIAQVKLIRGILFAGLEIIDNGVDNIVVNYVSKTQAARAKKIIDQKIHYAHAKEHPDVQIAPSNLPNAEKSLTRLRELLNKGVISQREYNSRKDKYLKHLE